MVVVCSTNGGQGRDAIKGTKSTEKPLAQKLTRFELRSP